MKNKRIFVTTLAIVVLFGGCNRRSGNDFRLTSSPDPNTNSGGTVPATSGNSGGVPVASYADVVNKTAPAVVTIHSQTRVRQPQQYPFMNDPFFRQFFGDRAPLQPPVERQRQGLGSGVIIDADG